jgi:DNA-binding LytR/AlgR family response regulator
MRPLRLFIAEDEPPALARLVEALQRIAPQAEVVGAAGTVQAARRWLAEHPAPDLLLLDIQLGDGLSLALFDDAANAPAAPVIFTTAHDAFVLEAFRCNAIDYLLKPVADAALAASLERYESLNRHFTANLAGLRDALQPRAGIGPGAAGRGAWRQRLVLRKGAAFASVRCEDIAWCTSIDKLSFVLTHAGERLLADESLAELEAALDPRRFFRANRQTLVQLDAVKSFRPLGKGQLKLELQPAADGDVIVSQERARAFRDWLQG